MAVLTVKDLCKSYAAFRLDHVSFTLKEGSIMGFIGRNGAGKTTTLKSLLNLVHPDQETIEFFDMDFKKQEQEIKQLIGYAAGECNYYPKKKLETIVHYTKPLFERWDESAYRNYMQLFELDDQKKLCELSCGMRVKFSLVLALSHHARLLILDEPTSGLDPVSRDELLNIFLHLKEKGISVLFSTHITSDLDKCAEDITYIKKGKIIASESMEHYIDRFRLVVLPQKTDMDASKFIGIDHQKNCDTGLINTEDEKLFRDHKILVPDLETIMVHMERGDMIC